MVGFLIITNIIIVYMARVIFIEGIRQLDRRLADKNNYYTKLRDENEKVNSQNMKLEANAENIFALYEVTKEITRALTKEELFLFFKDRLKDYMFFEDCQLLDDENNLAVFGDYLKFPLSIDKELLGYLVVKGVAEEDLSRFTILIKQFTLGLRRTRLYERIEEVAITDSLTASYTRRYCLERLSEEFQRAQKYNLQLSFLMMDVDHFKKYNDKYGHLVGDAVLREIARIMKSCSREIDLLGRFGGEEFAIILPDTSKEGALLAAERIRQQIAKQQINVYDEELKATISIGVANYPADAKISEELIDKSDWALYRAKKMGRNRVCAFGVFQ